MRHNFDHGALTTAAGPDRFVARGRQTHNRSRQEPSVSPSARATGLILLGALAASAPARATSERTFVASYGADSNPCSVAAPCRTFAAALGLTAAGGEVVALDSAGYGSVTITQSVSISAPAGVYAGVTPPTNGSGGVLINAPGATVVLRGLEFGPTAAGAYVTHLGTGIEVLAAQSVTVERCSFIGNLSYGISTLDPPAAQATGLTMSISNSNFVGVSRGINLNAYSYLAGASVTASIHNVSMNGSGIVNPSTAGDVGILAGDGVTASVDGSRIIGYGAAISLGSGIARSVPGQVSVNVTAINNVLTGGWQGVAAVNLTANVVAVTLRGNVISGATSAGAVNQPSGSSAGVYVSGNVEASLDANSITGNTVGVYNGGGNAVIQSYGSNQLEGNATDVVGTLTPAVTQ